MNNNKSGRFIFTFLIITLLLLCSFSSFGFSPNNDVRDKGKILFTSSNVISNKIKISSTFVKSVSIPLDIKSTEFLDYRDFNETNYVVANSIDEEYYPSIVLSDFDALVAYEINKAGANRICLRNSKDFGNTWSGPYQLVADLDNENPNIEVTSPSICKPPNNNEAYGAFTSPHNNSAITGVILIDDITDLTNPNDITVAPVEWSDLPGPSGVTYDFWDFQKPDTVAYDDQTTPWVFAFIGSTNVTNQSSGEGPCSDSPMIFHFDLDLPGYVTITWFPFFENCGNISITNDYGNDLIFGVCEIDNGTKNNLLFFDGNPQKWIVEEIFTYQNITTSGNLTHPQIFTQDDHIYIIAETDATGKNEIIIFHSSDDGKTWEDNIVTVNNAPEASFSYTMERLNVSFFDESSDIDGYITSWFWEFGDDDTSIDKNPQHEYSTPGTYKVNLTVEDDDEAISTFSKTIVIIDDTPIADFVYEPINPPINVDVFFNSTSIVYPGNEIVSYTWDFGDGSNLEYEQNVTHQYTDNGLYFVKLTVQDNDENVDTIEKKIKVGLTADFTYTPIDTTIDDTITFNDESSTTEGSTITSWTWDFGDGETSDIQNPTHQYNIPGVYSVTLIVEDESDNVNSIIKEILIKPGDESYVPSFPIVFADDNNVFCGYTLANNLLFVNSSDNGENWDKSIMINDQDYSVVEDYRFSDLPDDGHIIWTDNRNGNYDLFIAIEDFTEGDLRVIPESVNISKSEIPFLRTNNWITFSVENIGKIPVYDVEVEITINIVNESGEIIESKPTNYPVIIKKLGGGIYQKKIERPLFRINLDEFVNALKDFAGVGSITVTIDPDNQFSDTNPSNNAYTLPDITYAKIFPLLARFPLLEEIFKLLS